MGQAGLTGNKVTLLVISDTCWHLGFQQNLRQFAKICWKFSSKGNLLTCYETPGTSKWPPVLGRFQEDRNPPVSQPLPALPAYVPLHSWVLAGTRKDLVSGPNFTWTTMSQGCPQQAWWQTSHPRSSAVWRQYKFTSPAMLFAGVAKISPSWLTFLDILWSLSITFCSWCVIWEVFLFPGICIFCNWFLYVFWSFLLSKHVQSYSLCSE